LRLKTELRLIFSVEWKRKISVKLVSCKHVEW
jgi:hypothetical protein